MDTIVSAATARKNVAVLWNIGIPTLGGVETAAEVVAATKVATQVATLLLCSQLWGWSIDAGPQVLRLRRAHSSPYSTQPSLLMRLSCRQLSAGLFCCSCWCGWCASMSLKNTCRCACQFIISSQVCTGGELRLRYNSLWRTNRMERSILKVILLCPLIICTQFLMQSSSLQHHHPSLVSHMTWSGTWFM